jgi:excisionase family DNA binding protein
MFGVKNMRQLTETEMAEELNVTPRTLRKWRYQRIVPFTQIGYVIRFDPEAVFKALKQYERKPMAVRGGKPVEA